MPSLTRTRTTPPSPPRQRPGVAVAAVLAALVLGALVSSPALVRAATGLPVGAVRTGAVAVATGVDRLASALALDRPRSWLEQQRDGSAGTWLGFARPEPAATTTATAGARSGAGPEPALAGPRGDTEGDADGEYPAAPATRRSGPATADEPLRVLLAGDSLMGTIADGVGRIAAGREDLWWHAEVRVSTGLARPDVLDWPAHLDALVATHDPDVVVLLLGGNDDQSLTTPGGDPVHLGADGWERAYEQRIARMLEIAGAPDRTVVWLEVPAVRPDRLEATRQLMNAAAHRAVAARPDAAPRVTIVDTSALIAPGGYAPRLEGRTVRAGDGVHLTHAGGDLVAAELLKVLGAEGLLSDG